jgi:hypothetical protein
VRFTASPRDVAVAWSLSAGSGAAEIDNGGVFVAELPGVYTVQATIGARTAVAVVRVEARRVTPGIEVQAHLPIRQWAAEVWVHPNGRCAYLSTIADRVYAIDVSDPTQPRIGDSMMNDARINNDVMTTEDGKFGVFSREGASNRKNGIMVFDANDACHPKVIAEYAETVTGGVHSSYVYPWTWATASKAAAPSIPSSSANTSTTSTPPTRAWSSSGARDSCAARTPPGGRAITCSRGTRSMPPGRTRVSATVTI